MRVLVGRRLAATLGALAVVTACGDDSPATDAGVLDGYPDGPTADAARDAALPDAPADLDATPPPDGTILDADLGPCALTAPGAAWIAFSSRRNGNFDVFLIRADGTCERQITSDPADDLAPTWSPDGHTLAFSSIRAITPVVVTHDLLTSQGDVVLPVDGVLATAPTWSPDGASVAFEGHPSGSPSTAIYRVPSAGGTPVQLTDLSGYNAGPAWAPDGTIYFVSNRAGGYDIYSMTSDGDSETRVTTGSGILGKPAVSADGLTLAYARTDSSTGNIGIVLRTIASGAQTSLPADGDAEPSFSRTGTELAVGSTRHGDRDILLLDVTTGDENARLTTNDAIDGVPSFRWAE